MGINAKIAEKSEEERKLDRNQEICGVYMQWINHLIRNVGVVKNVGKKFRQELA